jgi:rhodanese-related sulfurtransferase
MSPPLLITLLVVAALVVGWYVFEGRWDRRLFGARPGQTCRNGPAAEGNAFLLTHPDALVLDVRSSTEFRSGALPGAVHLSIGDPEFTTKAGAFDRQRPVLVYCAGGYRSRKAVEILRSLDFTTIQHLHRGYHSWKLAGLPVQEPSS